MTLRGSYLSITRQLDELERRASRLTGPGCATCREWPEVAVLDRTGDAYDRRPASGFDDGGDPPPAWPEALVCPGCGREPRVTFAIEYADPDPGDLPIHLDAWRPGDTS